MSRHGPVLHDPKGLGSSPSTLVFHPPFSLQPSSLSHPYLQPVAKSCHILSSILRSRLDLRKSQSSTSASIHYLPGPNSTPAAEQSS